MTKRPGEFSLIADYFAPLAGEGAFGLKDDAAILNSRTDHDLIITQDACAEGIHFFHDDPADLIAQKALRVNLSDLAAKGARPTGFSVALGLGKNWDDKWVKAFAEGISRDVKAFEIVLTGGDTFTTGAGTVISITAIGEVSKGSYVSRLSAKSGDQIYVSGTIGDAALGLQIRVGNLEIADYTARDFLLNRYMLPRPRVELAGLVRDFASSSMDVSDGLIADASKLCAASDVSAMLKLDKVPLSPAAQLCVQNHAKWLDTAVTGGDDYEILFTVSPEKQEALELQIRNSDLPITHIGEISTGKGLTVFDKDGREVTFERQGYDHSGAGN